MITTIIPLKTPECKCICKAQKRKRRLPLPKGTHSHVLQPVKRHINLRRAKNRANIIRTIFKHFSFAYRLTNAPPYIIIFLANLFILCIDFASRATKAEFPAPPQIKNLYSYRGVTQFG